MEKMLVTNNLTGEVVEMEQIEQEVNPIEIPDPQKSEIEILQEQVKALTLALLEV